MTVDAIQAHAIEVLVVVMMLAVGVKLTVAELTGVRRQLDVLGRGLAANFLVAPAIVYALCVAFSLSGPTTIALLLCACAPGGPVGPLLVAQARGDLAYGVALMVTLAIISTATTPLLLAFSLAPGDGASIFDTVVALARTMIGFQLLPLLAGLGLRHGWPGAAQRLAGPLTRASNLLLVAVIAGLLVAKGGALTALEARALLAMILSVGLCLVAGALAGLGSSQTVRASALCTGVRNLAMALLLSASHFPDPRTDTAILSFGLFMLVLPALLALYWRRAAEGSAA